MGKFKERLKVCNLHDETKCDEFDAWVDTGSNLSFIPESIVKKLDLKRNENDFEVTSIHGQTVLHDSADAYCSVKGKRTPCKVVVAKEGGIPVIGAVLLEGLGFDVDLQNKKLKEVPLFGLIHG